MFNFAEKSPDVHKFQKCIKISKETKQNKTNPANLIEHGLDQFMNDLPVDYWYAMMLNINRFIINLKVITKFILSYFQFFKGRVGYICKP